MPLSNAEDFKLIRKLPLFAGLPDDTIRGLLRLGRARQYDRGAVLFFQEEPAESFFVVLNGWVKLSRETVEGDEYVIGMFSRGESFAEAAIFDSGRFPVTAEAVEPARVLVVPAKPFMDTISLDPQLAMSMLASMSRHLRHLVTQVEQLQAKSAPQRVGAFLLRLSEGVDKSITVQLPYDKSLIAARLGMKPETFSRALAKLRHLGIHSEGTNVSVPEPQALRRYCENERRA
jgi:CRP/FNR family transcriptional regulator, dissimilatory nitrate respiration regulator